MPIRFYCPFCEQLLGASSRKIGAVVECPSCRGKVGVPSPGAPPPLPPSRRPATGTVVVTPAQLAALAIVFLILAGLAFTAGLLVGALI